MKRDKGLCALRKKRILSTAIDLVDPTASIDLAISTADYFGLEKSQVKKIIKEVGAATASWHKEATRFKIKKEEISRMASAFEHKDLQKAIR